MAALTATGITKANALVASTATTVLALLAAANQAVNVVGFKVSFNGATSTNTPDLIEWGYITFATNAIGTNSTAVTPQKQDSARPETIQTTMGKAWTSEPTVWTVLDNMYLADFNGSFLFVVPYYAPIIVKGGIGFGIRLTTGGSTSSATCSLTFTE